MKRIAAKPPAQSADPQRVRQRESNSESTARVTLYDIAPIAKRIRATMEERWMMDEAQLASSSNWGSMNACYFEKHLLNSIIAGNYHMTLRSRRSVSLVPRPNVTTRRRLVPESLLLPVRICLCGKGGSKSVRATVLVIAQDPITLPSDIPLIREHRALMTGAAACTWRYKIKFCDVRTDAMPVFFEYGKWDTNRNPDDDTPYASQHSLQSFVIHRVPHSIVMPRTANHINPPNRRDPHEAPPL
jgi:hypothetical protein